MAKSKRGGAAHRAYYAKYKNGNIHDKNAMSRLKRALRRNPENEQITLAMGNIRRSRHTPKTPFWTSTRIREAFLYKLFTGYVNQDIFSNNGKVSAPARMTHGPKSAKITDKKLFATNSMFSLGSRVRWVGEGRF